MWAPFFCCLASFWAVAGLPMINKNAVVYHNADGHSPSQGATYVAGKLSIFYKEGLYMDTICLCRTFCDDEDIAKYCRMLPSTTPPDGCKSWMKPIRKGSARICLWIKINCHELLEVMNVADNDIKTLTEIISQWVGKVGLELSDFNINRIDYDYNIPIHGSAREAVIEILEGLPQRIMHLEKESFPHCVYYVCRSRHVHVYDKVKERTSKHKKPEEWEIDVCRQEVQCYSSHIRYAKSYYGLLPTWENWVNLDRQAEYLRKAKPVFPQGDFYPMDEAIEIIQASNLKAAKKRNLCKDLQLIASQGLGALKNSCSINTYKDHLACLENLGVNPFTLPVKYKNLGKIDNPFFH